MDSQHFMVFVMKDKKRKGGGGREAINNADGLSVFNESAFSSG